LQGVALSQDHCGGYGMPEFVAAVSSRLLLPARTRSQKSVSGSAGPGRLAKVACKSPTLAFAIEFARFSNFSLYWYYPTRFDLHLIRQQLSQQLALKVWFPDYFRVHRSSTLLYIMNDDSTQELEQ